MHLATMTRSVPLMMNVPFSVIKRHVAHIDVLLLDIENRAGFRFGIDLEHDQAKGDLHRRGIGDAPLTAFLNVIFGSFELDS